MVPDPSPLASVELRQLRKVFGRQPVLAGVSFGLRGGRTTLLMGPNGAGKSTLISVLSTLSRPTSGEVRYGELDHAQAERELRGRIGLLAHAPMLYEQMSSRENLLFFARMYRLARPAEHVAGWLERVGMADAADRPVRELSRGMLQRVGLARALLHEPDLVLLDEPFTGLDREATAVLRQVIAELTTSGKIVLLVTHEVGAVDGLCHHLVVLRRGRVAADVEQPELSAAQILEHYHAAL